MWDSLIHSKKSFWVSKKILSASLQQFSQTLLNPSDKKISSPIRNFCFLNGTESGFVCLMLSCGHRQRKSRNLSYTNKFNHKRSLTSMKKIKVKTTKNTAFPVRRKRVKKEMPSVLDTESIHSKF